MRLLLLEKQELIPKIENNIREAYRQEEYLRAYNLIKLLLKIEKKHPTALYYLSLIPESKLEQARRRWFGLSYWKNILFSKYTFGLILFLLFSKK